MIKAVCFTGHRPDKLGGYYGERAEKIQNDVFDTLVDVITRAYNNGFHIFISGGALGVDQLAAEAVIHLRDEQKMPIRLVIAKPFPSQSCKWPKSAQNKFDILCEKADHVFNVSEDPYTPEKMTLRNEWMVNRSGCVVAVWNGCKGGTGNCVDYARKMYKPIHIINPYTLEERWELPGKVTW